MLKTTKGSSFLLLSLSPFSFLFSYHIYTDIIQNVFSLGMKGEGKGKGGREVIL